MRICLLIFGCALWLIYNWLPALNERVIQIIFIAGIILVGIPHGAADVLVGDSNARIANQKFSTSKFLFAYVARLVIFATVLFLFPTIGIIVFIGLAAFHFGETDFNNFKTHTVLGKFVVFTYGILLLYVLLATHLHEVDQILRPLQIELLSTENLDYLNKHYFNLFFMILGLFFISFFMYLSKYGVKDISVEKTLIQIMVLLLLLYKMPLIIGFTFYFIFWHSILSLQSAVFFLKSAASITAKKIASQLVLYSTIAFIGILLLGYFFNIWFKNNSTNTVIFASLAILTAPHVQVFQDMYKKLRELNA